jgi:exosome complex RNA-binding protein Rrp4
MKLKAKLNKIHRANPNGLLCGKASLKKLKKGEVVEIPKDAADELLGMGFVELAKIKKQNKEVQ